MDTFTLLWKTLTDENTHTVMEPPYWYEIYIYYKVYTDEMHTRTSILCSHIYEIFLLEWMESINSMIKSHTSMRYSQVYK